MANLNVRNLPDEVHRAIRIQAAQNGRSTEAEIRFILERAVRPEGRVKLGSYLASFAREFDGLSNEEHALFTFQFKGKCFSKKNFRFILGYFYSPHCIKRSNSESRYQRASITERTGQ